LLEWHQIHHIVLNTNLYKAFGINWYSKQLLLPELKLSNNNSQDIVNVFFEDKKIWPKISSNKWNTNFIEFANNDLRLKIPNLASFRVNNGDKISIHRENEKVSDNDIRTFLLGSIFGGILIQREMLLLHANALSKDGQAILFMGHSGDGKSTLAYNLMKKGWKLLSDDLVAINSKFEVLPGIPRIKLWQDSITEFKLDMFKLPLVRENINKYLLMNENIEVEESKLPLKTLYVINRSSEDSLLNSRQFVNEKSYAMKLLLTYCYRNRFIKGLGKEKIIFLKIANLVNEKKIMIANIPNNIKKIDQWINMNNLLD